MTVVNSDPGEIAYEAYKLASDGVSLVSGARLPDWADVEPRIRDAWSAVEDGVIIGLGAMRQELPLDEPEPAKVIIVTEHGGRERHYDANGWDAEDAVDVTRDGEVIATYPPGAWTRIHRQGATLPDVTARKLSLAAHPLRR